MKRRTGKKECFLGMSIIGSIKLEEMKNKWIIAAFMLGAVTTVEAQNLYDAERVMSNELNGTARFVGMGGAMGALGGDISTIGTNPAGIGIFRSNDLSVSFGFNHTGAEATFAGTKINQDKTRASFDQIGFVYSNKIGNTTSLRYVNFAFNYHKSRNFNRLFEMGGNLDGFSQTWQLANNLNNAGITEKEINSIFESEGNPYTQNAYSKYSVLGLMGIRTGLVGWESNKALGYDSPAGWNGANNNYYSREKGGIQAYDFNVAFNLDDRFYLGATVGVYDLNYSRFSTYTENLIGFKGSDGGIYSIPQEGDKPVDNGGYTLDNYYELSGTGVDLKVGAIFRPFEESPFRFGIAVHTPTWYDLSEHYDAVLSSKIHAFDNREKKPFNSQRLSDYLSQDYLTYDYRIQTPWKFNVNMGSTVGTSFAFGAEYEYADYGTCKLRDVDGDELGDQVSVKKYLKGVHTMKVGAEYRFVQAFSVRAGYNYATAAFDKNAYNALAPYSTNTTFLNSKDRHTATWGLGYRGNRWYADLAYKYDVYKTEFFPFDDKLKEATLPATKIDFSRHQLLLTIGARF